MKKMKKVFTLIMMVVLVGSITACGGDDKATTKAKVMKVGLGVPENHFEYEAMVKFKENIETKTEGSVKVELFASNTIGSDKEVLEGIKLGSAQMNLPGPGVIGNFIKEFNILALPFLFENQEIADEVTSGAWGDELLSKLEEVGYVGLGFGDFGFRHTTNNIRPIEKLEDFKGLKIRTMQNPAHLDVFRALGANPTPMAFNEVFSALQQGVIDGQENPLKNIYSNKLHEVQKYLTLDGHVYSWVVFVVGKDFYDGLTPEEQQIVQESADIAIAHMREAVKAEDAESLELIKEAGVEVTEISHEVKTEMKEKVKPVVDKYANEISPEMYNKLVEEIEKSSK